MSMRKKYVLHLREYAFVAFVYRLVFDAGFLAFQPWPMPRLFSDEQQTSNFMRETAWLKLVRRSHSEGCDVCGLCWRTRRFRTHRSRFSWTKTPVRYTPDKAVACDRSDGGTWLASRCSSVKFNERDRFRFMSV